jgi:predicted FMN-binding regulatory protein PaiB
LIRATQPWKRRLKLEGKWKLSQNHPQERREQMISGLLDTQRTDDWQIARLMKAI